MYSAEKTVDESIARKMPEPTGYKLLIKPLEVKEKTESGIYARNQTVRAGRYRVITNCACPTTPSNQPGGAALGETLK